jgi:hypothetical protein
LKDILIQGISEFVSFIEEVEGGKEPAKGNGSEGDDKVYYISDMLEVSKFRTEGDVFGVDGNKGSDTRISATSMH